MSPLESTVSTSPPWMDTIARFPNHDLSQFLPYLDIYSEFSVQYQIMFKAKFILHIPYSESHVFLQEKPLWMMSTSWLLPHSPLRAPPLCYSFPQPLLLQAQPRLILVIQLFVVNTLNYSSPNSFYLYCWLLIADFMDVFDFLGVHLSPYSRDEALYYLFIGST